MKTRPFLSLTLLAALAFGAGCNGAGIELEAPPEIVTATKSEDDLEMLAVRPAYSRIVPGDRRPLALRAWRKDGRVENVAAESWISDDPTVAAIDDLGRVTGTKLGETLVRARYQGEEALGRVVVVEPTAPPADPPSSSDNPPPDPIDPGTNDDEDSPPPPEDPPSDDPPPPPGKSPCDEEVRDPFADRVVSHVTGAGGGFNEEDLPDIVLGPPKGLGSFQGSYDVFSLGLGGEIVLEFTDSLTCNGAGVDFIVFENAFQVGTNPDMTFAEPGVVSASEDGETWVDFPCNLNAVPYTGCAGVHPTLANPETNDIDPTDPAVAGGDGFDLEDIGLRKARFIKIQDSGLGLGPIGPGTRGFDLDAIAIVHGTSP